MAVIALVTADRVNVVESLEQKTAPAAEAIVAGAPVRFDTATGKFTNANGTLAAEARIYGVAVRTVPAGMAVTAVRRGYLDGFDLSGMAYDAAVYLSDTDGRLDTAAGTVSTVVGRVAPAFATTLGTAADKLLYVGL
jgi:hypothetical protein